MLKRNLAIWHILLSYLLFGVLWIYFSDRFLASLASGATALTILQAYKGWLFIAVTSLFLFLLLRRYERSMSHFSDALAESAQRYQGLFDSANDAFLLFSENGLVVEANERACRMYGYPHDRLVGMHGRELVHPDYLSFFGKFLVAGVEELQQTIESMDRRADGTPFAVEVRGAVVSSGGRPLRLAVVRDVSERQQAQLAMAEHLSLLKLAADVGVALTSGRSLREMLQPCCEAIARELSAAFARLWVVDEDEEGHLRLQASAGLYTHLDGAHGRIAINGATKIGNIAATRKAHLTNRIVGDPQVTDQEWVEREGMVAFAGHPLLVEGRLLGVMALFARQPLSEMALRALAAVADEIALGIERKRGEDALRRTTAEFEAIFHALPEGVLFADQEGRIVMVNPAFLEIFGYEFTELDGQPMTMLSAGEEGRQALSGGDASEAGGRPRPPREMLYRRRGGETFWGETIIAPVQDDQGKALGFLCISRDISGRKRAEEERLRLQEQVRQTQKMEAMGALAGGIAHDFNNILSAVLGYAELASYKVPAASEIASDLENVIRAGKRAKELVRQILAFSRQAEQEPQPVEIGLIVKEALKLLRASIPANIEIRQEIAAGCGAVLADPTQIHQVIMNLCTNAYHAMRETGGLLRVSLAPRLLAEEHALVRSRTLSAGDYLELVVADSGCGMTPEVAAKAFDPYFTTKEKGDGTGLGLSVVHGIVKACGGTIRVESEPGRGSAFFVYLPAIQGKGAREEVLAAAAPLPRGRGRILIVDDEESLARVLARMLAGLGYAVDTVCDSREALRLFADTPGDFDLVLTDMAMPGLTGAELTRQLLAIRADIPIILCTGFSEVINEEKAKALGIREFLLKPLLIDDVAQAVRRVLGKG